MQIPKQVIDLSMPLDNDTIVDPEIMRPKIQYIDQKSNAEAMASFFPGMRPVDLPDGEGWAWEVVTLTTHNGTHIDAPWHYHSHDKDGNRMKTIDELPLDWFYRPGVKLDFRHFPDGYIVQPDDVEAELKRIDYELQPLDIVLVNTKASENYGTEKYLSSGIGMGREATLYLTQEHGVRVTGIDAWGWDAPFSLQQETYANSKDAHAVWQGH